MKRREFLRNSLLATGAVSLNAFPYEAFASTSRKLASDKVELGSTGLEVTRLAMGTGTHGVGKQSNQTRKLGIEGLADLLEAACDEGVTFWDAADQYGTHPHLKAALKRVPREKVAILTKTHATTEQEMLDDLDRFRKELGTDYLDIVLLHCMMSGDWPEVRKGAMNVLAEAREEGIIKAHGVSCHTLPALKAAADSDWVQVDLARINPAGAVMDADVPTVVSVLQKMKADGKGVIGMKILGAGELTGHIDKSLQYVLGLDCVDCFTIGSESQAQFYDLTRKIRAASVRA